MAVNVDFDADVAQAVEDLPGEFTWDGNTYVAIIDPILKIEDVDGPNYRDDINFMIVVQTSLFTGSRPQVNDKITISGTEFRIEGAEADEADAALNLNIIEVG
jgi:hypothetical protein